MSQRSESATMAFVQAYGTEQQKNKLAVQTRISELRKHIAQECGVPCEYALGLPVVVHQKPKTTMHRQPHAKKGFGKPKRQEHRGLTEVSLTLPAGRSFD